METILITGHSLTLEELAEVCRKDAQVALSFEAKQNILESRQVVDTLVDEAAVVYGITTGFGKFSDVTITQDECKQLQRNLIVTHAVGAGEPFSRDVARGIMLLRINNLAKGFSGTRLELVETLVQMLNRGVTPVIPQKGSLGGQRRFGASFSHGASHAGLGTGGVSGGGSSRSRCHGAGRNPHHRIGGQGGLGSHQWNASYDFCGRLGGI